MEDLRWLPHGDYHALNGDFEDTSDDIDLSVFESQEVMSRLQTSLREFVLLPDMMAASLEMSMGKSATEEEAELMAVRTRKALINYPFLKNESRVKIKTLVFDNEKIGLFLRLTNPNYPQPIYFNVLLDYKEHTAIVYKEETM